MWRSLLLQLIAGMSTDVPQERRSGPAEPLALDVCTMLGPGGPLFVLSTNADDTLMLDPTDQPVPLDLLRKVAAIAEVELVE